MEEFFLRKKNDKCILLVVDKKKSFDTSLKGDFNLENNLLSKKKIQLEYIYTGLQIINPKVFIGINESIFSINKIWDHLIANRSLQGIESDINFLHVSTLNIYKKLIKEFKF